MNVPYTRGKSCRCYNQVLTKLAGDPQFLNPWFKINWQFVRNPAVEDIYRAFQLGFYIDNVVMQIALCFQVGTYTIFIELHSHVVWELISFACTHGVGFFFFEHFHLNVKFNNLPSKCCSVVLHANGERNATINSIS